MLSREQGKLSSMPTIHFTNQSIFQAPFNWCSISGLARMFSCLYRVCDFSVESWNVPKWLSRVSRPGIVPPPATQNLTQIGRKGQTVNGQGVYSSWDDRTRLTYRMDMQAAYICSKVGGYGCPISFQQVSATQQSCSEIIIQNILQMTTKQKRISLQRSGSCEIENNRFCADTEKFRFFPIFIQRRKKQIFSSPQEALCWFLHQFTFTTQE